VPLVIILKCATTPRQTDSVRHARSHVDEVEATTEVDVAGLVFALRHAVIVVQERQARATTVVARGT
jgi:hypothetical protein